MQIKFESQPKVKYVPIPEENEETKQLKDAKISLD